MKKIIFSLVALVASMSMNAQVMKVMKNGEVVATYEGADYEYVFEEARVSTTGTAKRTGDIDVPWVQLWENGPKFAAYNVGAANNVAEDCGGYYAWGGSQDKVDDHNTDTEVLTGAADTATKLWGSNWRMPTKAELEALLAYCDVEITTVNGVSGRKYTGKGDYSSNSMFLPAAESCLRGQVIGKGNGHYWSSTPQGSNSAYNLGFSITMDYQKVEPGLCLYGQAVRAVLAEEEINSTTGTAKATIGDTDVNVTWIQLWENGPKFAEYNVGAVNNKAEDYGGYYAWGGSQDKVDDHNTYTEVLTGAADTATKLWGSNWRMPTKAELEALLDNCEVTWTKVNGVSGCKCTGKGTYSANSIFLPASGASDHGTIVGKGESGYYWASDPGDNEYLAPNLYFCSYKDKLQDLFVSPGLRYMGQAVRAVLAE